MSITGVHARVSTLRRYWAEGTQAWFNGTLRTDVTSGLTSREALQALDRPLADCMAAVWGTGPWRYTTTAPRPFKPFVPAGQQQRRHDYTQQSHAGVVSGNHRHTGNENGGRTRLVGSFGARAWPQPPWHMPGIIKTVPGGRDSNTGSDSKDDKGVGKKLKKLVLGIGRSLRRTSSSTKKREECGCS